MKETFVTKIQKNINTIKTNVNKVNKLTTKKIKDKEQKLIK